MSSVDSLDWQHLKVFLATLRHTSLRTAAESLGLSHPTARRHLAALEEQLGFQLFERRRDGLHPTIEAESLRSAAQEVEQAVQSLRRIARAADPALHGPIKVTAPGTVATDLLMSDFVEFQKRWPGIELQVDVSYAVADLDKREADIAIRAVPTGKLPARHLAGRKAGTVHQAVYGEGEHWIGWSGNGADQSWIGRTEFAHLPVRGAFKDPALQRSACAAGLGLSLLPCFYAQPLLRRRSPPRPDFDLWVLVHPDLRRSPRLRVFRDFIVDAIARHRPRLEGLTAGGVD